MALPTEAEIQAQISNAVAILKHIKPGLETGAQSYIKDEDTLVQSLEGDLAPAAAGALRTARGNLSQFIASMRAVLDPLWRTYAVVIGSPAREIPAIFEALRTNFAENSKRIATRPIIFGAGPVFAGSGTGRIIRATQKMAKNLLFDITATHLEERKFTVSRDSHMGAVKWEETVEVRGKPSSVDNLDRDARGSGVVATLQMLSSRASTASMGIQNPSFEQFTGTTNAPTAITGWTVGTSIANFEIDQLNIYRDTVGFGTPASLKIKSNDLVRQRIQSPLRPGVPHIVQVAFNRSVGGADGTLSLKFGQITASVVLTTQTGWNVLRINPNSTFLENINMEPLEVRIERSGGTVGFLLVDDLVASPMTEIDGSFYAAVATPDSGDPVPPLLNDSGSLTDAAGATPNEDGIGYWLWRLYGEWLPHATGAGVTWADPA